MRVKVSKEELIRYFRENAKSFYLYSDGGISAELAFPDFIELEAEPIIPSKASKMPLEKSLNEKRCKVPNKLEYLLKVNCPQLLQ